MITSELTLLVSLLLLCLSIAFVAYWRGVNAGEQSQKARVERLLNELDEYTETLHILAAERHPAGRALRVVREDGAS